MTLVVGHAAKDIGFLVGDTLLSSEFELKGDTGPVNEKFHALKIQILDSDTAVAFAGDVETSFDLIKKLCDELRADRERRYHSAFGSCIKPHSRRFIVSSLS